MQRPLQALRDNGQHTTNRRGAFSLIELIVVILIIAILSSLLLVGVQAAVGRARETAVGVDVKNLEQGIKEFQAKFQVTDPPPSSLILFESATGWSGSSNTPQNLATIRKLWPNFLKSNNQPDINGDNMVTAADDLDINGDGDKTAVIRLNGAECLAFFMGGIFEPNADGTFIPHGFSVNPQNPFYRPALSTDSWGTRIGPFVSMSPTRLMEDTDPINTTPDLMPVYLDAFPSSQVPYQYFSAYGGRGYRLSGLDGANSSMAEKQDDEVIWLSTAEPTLRSVYLQKDVNYSMPMVLPAGTPWNPKTYQIISAGMDKNWGVGGAITDQGVPTDGTGVYRQFSSRMFERDNITNFKGGKLN